MLVRESGKPAVDIRLEAFRCTPHLMMVNVASSPLFYTTAFLHSVWVFCFLCFVLPLLASRVDLLSALGGVADWLPLTAVKAEGGQVFASLLGFLGIKPLKKDPPPPTQPINPPPAAVTSTEHTLQSGEHLAGRHSTRRAERKSDPVSAQEFYGTRWG